MELPEFELLQFLRAHVKPGAHNLTESNWFGTPVEVSHSRDYNENNGLPELRKTLAEMHGVEVEQLLLTAGASEAKFLWRRCCSRRATAASSRRRATRRCAGCRMASA